MRTLEWWKGGGILIIREAGVELPESVFGFTQRFIDLTSAGKSRVEGGVKMLGLNCAVNVRTMEADTLVIPLFAKYNDGSFSDVGINRTLFERGF
jgi:hypothetical protein